MKLDQNSIMYAIKKFSEQTARIKNPASYMITVLYNAPEQYYLDMKNKTSNETVKTEHSYKEKNNPEKVNGAKNSFHNFKQRTYDFDQLEKELLSR